MHTAPRFEVFMIKGAGSDMDLLLVLLEKRLNTSELRKANRSGVSSVINVIL